MLSSAILLACLGSISLSAADLLSDFRPSSIRSDYGAEDPRVKINHWTRLEPLLKKYGKDYQAIVEGKQGHGFREQDASITFYAALGEFLAKHLGGRRANVRAAPPQLIEVPAKK